MDRGEWIPSGVVTKLWRRRSRQDALALQLQAGWRSAGNGSASKSSRAGVSASTAKTIKTNCTAGAMTSPTRWSARSTTSGACLLNPSEMGFEPLKPVGEPDAANSRIRFGVRVEVLRPSFVAPFPRWRSSAHCECGKGRSPPLGELQDIVGEADEAPLVGDLLDAAQEKLTEAARLLDLSEHRLGQLLS